MTRCQMCGERPAKVHFTEMKDDEVKQLRLCEQCAEERGFTKMDEKVSYSLPDFLGGMADENLPGERQAATGAGCGGCGLTYSEFKKTGRLGCSECYDIFRAPLAPLLKRIHGTDQHTGKTPAGKGVTRSRRDEIRSLMRDLEESVRLEDFEQAALLRDKVRTLEQENGS